jgi:hypothetical protein
MIWLDRMNRIDLIVGTDESSAKLKGNPIRLKAIISVGMDDTDGTDKDLVVQEIGGRFLEDSVCLRQELKKLISHGRTQTQGLGMVRQD